MVSIPIRVIGPRDPRNRGAINTTSHAGWSRDLSPFVLGPVVLYDGIISQNMENAWQYSKVYPAQTDETGRPAEAWYRWARGGWNKRWADRYPMGKGVRPLYSFWAGEQLDYIEARKRIYIPLYAKAVQRRRGYAYLRSRYLAGDPIVLWDFDGYDYLARGMTLAEVIEQPLRKMGHAFVLAMLLEQHPAVAAWQQ